MWPHGPGSGLAAEEYSSTGTDTLPNKRLKSPNRRGGTVLDSSFQFVFEDTPTRGFEKAGSVNLPEEEAFLSAEKTRIKIGSEPRFPTGADVSPSRCAHLPSTPRAETPPYQAVETCASPARTPQGEAEGESGALDVRSLRFGLESPDPRFRRERPIELADLQNLTVGLVVVEPSASPLPARAALEAQGTTVGFSSSFQIHRGEMMTEGDDEEGGGMDAFDMVTPPSSSMTTTALCPGSPPPMFTPAKELLDPKSISRRWLQRQDSLLDRKDYTPMILKREPSMLLYDRHYHLRELLGRGDFGEVWMAVHHRTGKEFALKKSTRRFRGRLDRAKYLREVQNVAQLGHHPNLVHYERAWQDDGHFFIVMELCRVGTLGRLIAETHGPMQAETARNYAKGMLRGLARLHAQELLHLDLKPDNLFVMPDGGIKIGDFGLCLPATEWDEEEGDREYLAPEILQDIASPAADIFSAGLVLYQMLYGVKRLPGTGPGWQALRSRTKFPPPPPCQGEAAPAPPAVLLSALLSTMLSPEPSERPSAVTLLADRQVWGDEPQTLVPGAPACGQKRTWRQDVVEHPPALRDMGSEQVGKQLNDV